MTEPLRTQPPPFNGNGSIKSPEPIPVATHAPRDPLAEVRAHPLERMRPAKGPDMVLAQDGVHRTTDATDTIPLAKIAPPRHDIKPDRTADDVKAKLDSILQQGVLSALLGFWREDGMFELIDGLTRYLALLMGGFKEAPIRDLGRIPSDVEGLEMAVTCNVAHSEMTNLQLADAIARHQKLTGGTQAAACHAFSIKPVRGSKIKGMFKAPQEVLEMMAAGELKPRAVYALGRLTSRVEPPIVIALAKKARDLPMAVESVEEEVARLLGGNKRKAAKPVKITIGSVTFIISKHEFGPVYGAVDQFKAALVKAEKNGLGMASVATIAKQ